LLGSPAFDALARREVLFKCELMQRTGSFKLRGACNAVALALDAAPSGAPPLQVTTHSSGNHAAALACAAALRGVEATIVMPSNAPAVKRRAVEGFGAAIISCEPTQAAREAAAQRVVDETGAVFVHPSEDRSVIAGQGTVALELLEQVAELVHGASHERKGEGSDVHKGEGGLPLLDAVIVPVGGGGLVSGIATLLKARDPRIRVIAAEPLAANDAFRSKASGRLEGHAGGPGSSPATMADGLKTTLGPNTFPIVRDLVDEIVCVSEAEISAALRVCYEQLKLAVEPSAAVGVAALLSAALGPAARPELRRVAVILCGGNVDLDTLPALLAVAAGTRA
jgi:cysteine synthase